MVFVVTEDKISDVTHQNIDNLAGQRISGNHSGIAIEGGKKVVR